MHNAIDNLTSWIMEVPEEFTLMSELEVSQRPLPEKWSKKEILGHLCDSAINNLIIWNDLLKYNMKNSILYSRPIIKFNG